MSKLLKHLCLFFSPGLVFGLMQFIIKWENSSNSGRIKKEYATADILKAIKNDPALFGSTALNPALPWEKILPLLIDLIIKVLNELFGKKWIKEANDLSGKGGK